MSESCDCKEKLEAKLKERFEAQHPEATEHAASLSKMYGLFLKDNTFSYKPYSELTLTAKFPLKKGGFKEKTIKSNIIFNYCPFCGIEIGDNKIKENSNVL